MNEKDAKMEPIILPGMMDLGGNFVKNYLKTPPRYLVGA